MVKLLRDFRTALDTSFCIKSHVCNHYLLTQYSLSSFRSDSTTSYQFLNCLSVTLRLQCITNIRLRSCFWHYSLQILQIYAFISAIIETYWCVKLPLHFIKKPLCSDVCYSLNYLRTCLTRNMVLLITDTRKMRSLF